MPPAKSSGAAKMGGLSPPFPARAAPTAPSLAMISSLPLLVAGLCHDPGTLVSSETAFRTSADGVHRPQDVSVVEFSSPRRVRLGPDVHGVGPQQRVPVVHQLLHIDQFPDGDMPREVTYSMDGTEVLTVQRDTDNVTFYDAATRTATHTVQVGDFPVDIEVTPDNQYAVVPNVLDATLSVIEMASHTVIGTVPLTGEQPFAVEVMPNSRFVAVALINDAVTSSVSLVDLLTLTEARVFETGPQGAFGFFFSPESGMFGNLFTDFEMTPDGSKLVLVERPNARVKIYNIVNGNVIADLAVADVPGDVDISADGTVAVVEHAADTRRVTRIDMTTLTVADEFTTTADLAARRIRITPDKAHALVGTANEVHFIDLADGGTDAIIGTGTVGDIELSSDGAYAFVGNVNSRLIDLASQSEVGTFTFGPTYELAVSPTAPEAVGVNNRFREDLHFYDISGPGGGFLGAIPSGEPAEGDSPRSLAMSADGSTLVVVNNTSSNAAVVDVESNTVRAYVDTGLRSLEAAVDATGTRAVVTNGDDDTVTLIDLTTDTVAHTFSIPGRPSEVEMSPDGSMAYVTSVAGVDRLWFLDLDTPAVVSSLPTGQMGAVFYTYNVFSGIDLSPDGSTLAVCVSFDNELLLVDTQSMTELDRVPVGDFPMQVSFSPDGGRAYVTNAFSDNLYVIDVAGASSSVDGIVDGIPSPLGVDVDGDDAYVGSWGFGNPGVYVVDTGSVGGSTVPDAFVPLDSSPRASVLDGSNLWVALTDGELALIDAAGGSSSLVATVPLSGSPSDLAHSPAAGVVYAAQPGVDDALDVVATSQPSSYCISAPNSAGAGATIGYTGTTSLSANEFVVEVQGMPPGVPVLFFYGSAQVQVPFGNGFRCAGAAVQRLFPARHADPTGRTSRLIDFTQPPVSEGPKAIEVGSTWNFQLWYRDPAGGGPGFNLSNALQASFTP